MNSKTFLVIGGSSGIGKAIVQQLSATGAAVHATYRNHPVGNESSGAVYHYLDVTQPEPDMTFLPPELDGLVYCPGNIRLAPFGRIKPQDFVDDYQLQVVGAVRCIQAALPSLKKSPQSAIVLFSTVAVQTGFNFHTLVASSKGAVEGLTRSLAAELSPKVRVNCIAPSITRTPLAESLLNTPEKTEASAQRHPLKRIGAAEDIANLATFLLSDASSWITGQVLHIDGGVSAIR